jgi:hypothetical protein
MALFGRGARENSGRSRRYRERAATAFVCVVGAAGFGGCAETTELVERVSNEFSCPPERVNVIERRDIAPALYDVEACGRRGRYMCIVAKSSSPSAIEVRKRVVSCVHEPDPPGWDPDPAIVANFPWDESRSPPDAHAASVCSDSSSCGCLARHGSGWSWRTCERPSPAPVL